MSLCKYNQIFLKLRVSTALYLYSFPVAVLTNEHKLDCFSQQKYTISWFWRPEIHNQYHQAKIKASAGLHALQKFQEWICYVPLAALEAASMPWCVAALLQCPSATLSVSLPSSYYLLFVSNLPLPPFYKDTHDCTYLYYSKSQDFLPCNPKSSLSLLVVLFGLSHFNL